MPPIKNGATYTCAISEPHYIVHYLFVNNSLQYFDGEEDTRAQDDAHEEGDTRACPLPGLRLTPRAQGLLGGRVLRGIDGSGVAVRETGMIDLEILALHEVTLGEVDF